MPGPEIAGPPLPEVPFSSVPEMVAARAAVEPARVAVRSRSPAGKWVDLSWGTLDARRRAVAGGFAALGVKRGDVVAFLSHNSPLQQAALGPTWDISEKDVFLSWLPWHHCFGALFERLMALWNRALLVIDDSRGRELDGLIRNLLEVRPTVYFAVPASTMVWSPARRESPRRARPCFPCAWPSAPRPP
jgi:long-subunit acyl-CoA synthetase (AMP-forming)